MTMVVGDDGNSIGTFKILSVVGIRVQEPSRIYAPFVYRLGPRPFTAVRGVRFSYGVPVYFKESPLWTAIRVLIKQRSYSQTVKTADF